jgi:parallel beta-helix repeat protein
LAGLSIVLGWVAVGGFFGLFGRPVHADSFTPPVTDVADVGSLTAEVADTGHGAAPKPAAIPLLSSGCIVTSTLDSGPGSLRACMALLGAGDVITFDTVVFPPDDPQTITIDSALPAIATDNVTIDGSSAGVILDGSGAPEGTDGLVIDGASHVVIKGLQIWNFSHSGIKLQNGASHNTIGGMNESPGGACTGDCNLISGNGESGITIFDSGTMSNTISGNYIGTDASGAYAIGNSYSGLSIEGIYNVIGGDTPGERNLISGNDHNGVFIHGASTMSNTISGNYIGTDSSGTYAIGNCYGGVNIEGAAYNVIGGDTPGERNILSGNGGEGVHIAGIDAVSNTVSGNYVGTDVSGTFAIGNGYTGLSIDNGAAYNVIGGNTADERNLISGNTGRGVLIYGSGTASNTVSGNYIGTDASGMAALGNANDGIEITDGASYNVIGGDTDGERNLISGNNNEGMGGIVSAGNGTMSNTVKGNYIGTDVSGTSALPNGCGVDIRHEASGNVISDNIISGNGIGVTIRGSGTMNNTLSGNKIGTDVSGTFALPNTGSLGVFIRQGTSHNTISNNLISGNSGYGVGIGEAGTKNNRVIGNYIGTDISGTSPIGNARNGVTIGQGGQYNVIGGTTPDERNLISGNGGNGVAITDNGTMSNTVSGNYIGTNASGTAALGNSEAGVLISDGAQYNVIGGDTAGERNLISGNSGDGVCGVFIIHSGTMSNTVSGNYIGTNASGTAAIGNGCGVGISEGAQYNLIGGTTAGERNIISGNDFPGVGIQGISCPDSVGGGIQGSNTMNNIVSGNYIGTDASGMDALGNGGHGVVIDCSAQYNLIGGDTPEQRNVISGNGRRGVNIRHSSTMSNTVSGNYIGTNASGAEAIGNAESGVSISIGAQYNLIGGDTPEERNIISGNGKHGVRVMGSGTMHNTISGNYIGTNVPGAAAIGNVKSGVVIGDGAQYNLIGGDTASDRNLISGNDAYGVFIYHIDTIRNTISQNSIYSNGGKGIELVDGGNIELSPPTLITVTTDTVIGIAVPNSTVEVFSDNEDEGQVFEGNTTADGSGNFTFNKPDGFTLSNVTATATDVDGNTSEFSNIPPTVGAITGPLDPVQVGTEVNVSADFTDPNSEDTHTATWDWGDGTTTDGTVTNRTVSDSHVYVTPGVYTIELTVRDSAGGTGLAVYQFVVVYDPEGGFVTGGGWIDSPAGAYAPDPSLTGKATFGFVAKYKKGATEPTGQTEFRFRVADLNFHSDTYQWLVVAGPKAQFKGTGTINGAGDYGFMLTAIDAALTPSTDVDRFRIKIWDKDNGEAIVYDNQMGDADDADPATAIGGGSIVIHKEK